MKKRSDDLLRLQRILLSDDLRIPNGVTEILKTDVAATLDGYFELDGDPQIELTVQAGGAYRIDIHALAKRVKKVKSL